MGNPAGGTARLSGTGAPALAGKTPVLQYHFNWKTLSAIAGREWWNFSFRSFPETRSMSAVAMFQQ
jgi:hypothetical protein